MEISTKDCLPRIILKRVYDQLNLIWAESGAWEDYISAMSQTLLFANKDDVEKNQSENWALLPGLCCQGAGGNPCWADDLAGAWYLFYIAADLMDKIQDQDTPHDWWAELGPAIPLNAASGLFFSASLLLNNLHDSEDTKGNKSEVISEFYQGFLRMCGGQHGDLLYSPPKLDQFWDIAASKSGSFFSLACRSGARLATDDLLKIDGYGKFGHHLGVLIQILDDLESLKYLHLSAAPDRWLDFSHSLPAIYAVEVLPPSIASRLTQCLEIAHEDCDAANDALEIIELSGAVLYIEAEIERNRVNALAGLGQASPQSLAGEKLGFLLNSLLS